MIANDELERRRSRTSDTKFEVDALLELNRALAKAPEKFFQHLVDTALKLSGAHSTGISLLNESEDCFVWPAVAGALSPLLRSGTPRGFGPCGTVLDRDRSLLMIHPERHFAYLEPITPPLEEVLLIPFYVAGRAVGTIWAVSHEQGHKFDREDRRLLEELSQFAATAYKILADLGMLEPLLEPLKA